MTENKGDLISREALKKAIMYKDNVNSETWEQLYDSVLAEIDNAPTVEIPVARWDCYCEGQKVGYEKALSERPQGEWITDNWGMFHCNYCMREKQQLFNNFCSYCGADMRGKEE